MDSATSVRHQMSSHSLLRAQAQQVQAKMAAAMESMNIQNNNNNNNNEEGAKDRNISVAEFKRMILLAKESSSDAANDKEDRARRPSIGYDNLNLHLESNSSVDDSDASTAATSSSASSSPSPASDGELTSCNDIDEKRIQIVRPLLRSTLEWFAESRLMKAGKAAVEFTPIINKIPELSVVRSSVKKCSSVVGHIDEAFCAALLSLSTRVISTLTNREMGSILECFSQLAELRKKHEQLLISKADDEIRFKQQLKHFKSTIQTLASELMEKTERISALECQSVSDSQWVERLHAANAQVVALEQQLAAVRASRRALEDEIRLINEKGRGRNAREADLLDRVAALEADLVKARISSATQSDIRARSQNSIQELVASQEEARKLRAKLEAAEASGKEARAETTTLKAETKALKLQLADVEDFLSTKRGEHVKMLEMALATTRLELARAQAENDMLTMGMGGPV